MGWGGGGYEDVGTDWLIKSMFGAEGNVMPVAVAHRSIAITKQLLEHGMDVNVRYDLHGHTALHWAAEHGGMDMVSLVL